MEIKSQANRKIKRLSVLITILLFLVIWEALVLLLKLPVFILPTPLQVAERFVRAMRDGSLLQNSAATLLEVMGGLASGVLFATLMGYMLAKSRFLENVLQPFLVASQAIPIVAIAPLLVIWFGSGIFSKILICALTVFFPVLVNTVVGLRAVPENLRDLMRSMRATPWQTFSQLELPAALPVLLGGAARGGHALRDRRRGGRTGGFRPRAGIFDQRRPRPVRHGAGIRGRVDAGFSGYSAVFAGACFGKKPAALESGLRKDFL